MGQINRTFPRQSADQAFLVTVALPMGTQAQTNRHAERVLRAIERAGYKAGATSDEVIQIIAEQKRLVDGLVENGEHHE